MYQSWVMPFDRNQEGCQISSSESLYTHPILSLPSRIRFGVCPWRRFSWAHSHLSMGTSSPIASPPTFSCLSSPSPCVVFWGFQTTVLSLFLHFYSCMVASWEQHHPFISSPVLAGNLAGRRLSILTTSAKKLIDPGEIPLELTLALTEFLI